MKTVRNYATGFCGAFVAVTLLSTGATAAPVEGELPAGIALAFFPSRPSNVDIRYRTGVLILFGAGNKSGSAKIRDASGRTFDYSIGTPIVVDGKITHCASPPVRGRLYVPILCESGWPADVVIGSTRVRIYYWHDVTPRGEHVDVTDEIDRAP